MEEERKGMEEERKKMEEVRNKEKEKRIEEKHRAYGSSKTKLWSWLWSHRQTKRRAIGDRPTITLGEARKGNRRAMDFRDEPFICSTRLCLIGEETI